MNCIFEHLSYSMIIQIDICIFAFFKKYTYDIYGCAH